jgi:transposase
LREQALHIKKTFRASERDTEVNRLKRSNFLAELATIPHENRVYLDEAGSNLAMSPMNAWSFKNKRAYDKKPARRGGNLSMIGALRNNGLKALYPYDGAVNSDKFIHFIENKLADRMGGNDVLIMDNSNVHHSKAVMACFKKNQIKTLYMSPYSPELNPIEEAWSIVKNRLRREKARTLSTYLQAMGKAQKCVTPDKAQAFFKHAETFQILG